MPASVPIRVLVVEDNETFRRALELLLELRDDVAVIASVDDGARAAEAARELAPDVILMDYRLPGMDGVEATAAVREACPEVAVICLTASASRQEREAVAAAGAHSCLTKDSELEEIVAAIHAAAGAANEARFSTGLA